MVNTDSYTTSRDEALELCIHHLRLAALFFEAGPEPLADWENEMKRIMKKVEGASGRKFPPELKAGLLWLRCMHETYEQMKVDD